MRVKVNVGRGEALCRTCENGRVFQRANGDEEGWCFAGTSSSVPVPLDIVKCTDYGDKRRTSRYELEKIAWTLDHDKGGRICGFTPPKKET